jgi:hypothetical protein
VLVNVNTPDLWRAGRSIQGYTERERGLVFNWDDEAETKAGYTAAIEAVLGVAAQKMPVTEKAVEEWLDVSLSGIDEHKHIRRHAMAVAMRMIRGPMHPPN